MGLYPGRGCKAAGVKPACPGQQTALTYPYTGTAAALHRQPPDRAPCPRGPAPAGEPPYPGTGKLSVRQADKLVDQMLAAPNSPSPCRRTIPMVRDVRFFVNTLQHAVDLMTQKGIQATTHCDKHDGCLEYIVRIPVGSDGRPVQQPTTPPQEPAKEYAAEV